MLEEVTDFFLKNAMLRRLSWWQSLRTRNAVQPLPFDLPQQLGSSATEFAYQREAETD